MKTGGQKKRREQSDELTRHHPALEVQPSQVSPQEARRLIHELEVHQIELEMQNAELLRVQQELQKSNDRCLALYDNAPIGYLTTDEKGTILEANLTLTRIIGVQRNQLIGSTLSRFISKKDSDKYFLHRQRLWQDGERQIDELRIKPVDSKQIYTRLESVIEENGQNGAPEQHSVIIDISARKRAEHALLEAKERLQVTLNSIADAVIATDAGGNVVYINAVGESMIGWTLNQLMGLAVSEMIEVVDENTCEPLPCLVTQCLSERRVARLKQHATLISRAGRRVAIQASAAPVHGTSGEIVGAVMVFSDVSETRRMTQRMAHLANHDSLTGLVNRREFERRLGNSLSYAKSHGHEHVLCYLDLDQFKIVNDSVGHAAGDELLKQVTVLLLNKVRARDTLGRLGGDEFGLLLENCPFENAVEVAQGLIDTVREFRFVWQEHTFNIGVSIGLAQINAAAKDTNELLSRADVACYTAKDLGRNRLHVYETNDAELAVRHREIRRAAKMNDALREQRFKLYKQPILALSSQSDVPRYYELLLRLEEESGKLLLPGAFIPPAERYGIMPKLDRWVIEQALRYYASISGGHTQTRISINISGNSLNDDSLLTFIKHRIEDSIVPPDRICFEVTETAAINNLGKAAQFMTQVRQYGCQFALDDFGRGLSSFTYLRNLPVDYLKIDGSFVLDIEGDPIDRAMVSAINQLGHLIGLKTIAECAETQAAVSRLKTLGVDYAQGYALGRPQAVSMASTACN